MDFIKEDFWRKNSGLLLFVFYEKHSIFDKSHQNRSTQSQHWRRRRRLLNNCSQLGHFEKFSCMTSILGKIKNSVAKLCSRFFQQYVNDNWSWERIRLMILLMSIKKRRNEKYSSMKPGIPVNIFGPVNPNLQVVSSKKLECKSV